MKTHAVLPIALFALVATQPRPHSAGIDEQAGDSCSVCGGYGYTYRIGDSGSSRTVQQLLGKS